MKERVRPLQPQWCLLFSEAYRGGSAFAGLDILPTESGTNVLLSLLRRGKSAPATRAMYN